MNFGSLVSGALVLVLACWWLPRAAEAQQPAQDQGISVQVLSFNIRYGTARDGQNAWPHRRELVIQTLKSRPWDFVGLQEALRFQLDEIEKALPELAEVGVGRKDGRTAPAHRHLGSLRTQGDGPGRVGVQHPLRPPEPALARAKRSARLLAERIAGWTGGEPVVVTGDFNAGEDNPAIEYLTAPGRGPVVLQDTFRILHPKAEQAGTFNAFRGRRDGAKID